MELYINFFHFHILSFFLVFKHDFIGCVDLPISQLQTQQVMTSQIRSFAHLSSRNWQKI